MHAKSMAEQPTTVANYLMTNVAEALRLVVLTRSVREYENRDEEDFPVDLVLPDGATDDFSSNRQLRPRAIEAWNEAKVSDNYPPRGAAGRGLR